MVGFGDRPLPRSTVDLLLALGRQSGFSELRDWMPARENRRGCPDQQFSRTRVSEKNRRLGTRTLTRSRPFTQRLAFDWIERSAIQSGSSSCRGFATSAICHIGLFSRQG